MQKTLFALGIAMVVLAIGGCASPAEPSVGCMECVADVDIKGTEVTAVETTVADVMTAVDATETDVAKKEDAVAEVEVEDFGHDEAEVEAGQDVPDVAQVTADVQDAGDGEDAIEDATPDKLAPDSTDVDSGSVDAESQDTISVEAGAVADTAVDATETDVAKKEDTVTEVEAEDVGADEVEVADEIAGSDVQDDSAPDADDADADEASETDASSLCVAPTSSCDDVNPCTDDSCDPQVGCVHTKNNAPCNDGDACTTGDACTSGTCKGAPITCDDGNFCTDDSCDSQVGCAHTDASSQCQPLNVCASATCYPEFGCVSNQDATHCDDGIACTDDSCNASQPAGSECVHVPNNATCDDGNSCTDDVCIVGKGCKQYPNTTTCDDANACTVGDACENGTCKGTPISCDDGNVCTNDSCDSVKGCQNVSNQPVYLEDFESGMVGANWTLSQYAQVNCNGAFGGEKPPEGKCDLVFQGVPVNTSVVVAQVQLPAITGTATLLFLYEQVFTDADSNIAVEWGVEDKNGASVVPFTQLNGKWGGTDVVTVTTTIGNNATTLIFRITVGQKYAMPDHFDVDEVTVYDPASCAPPPPP